MSQQVDIFDQRPGSAIGKGRCEEEVAAGHKISPIGRASRSSAHLHEPHRQSRASPTSESATSYILSGPSHLLHMPPSRGTP
jgi:hypothetical protein